MRANVPQLRRLNKMQASKQETLNKLGDFTLGSVSLVSEAILLGGGGGGGASIRRRAFIRGERLI